MSAVVGIDLSTRALDLVKLNESDNRAEWVRLELAGKDAWERTLGIGINLGANQKVQWLSSDWWEDVYLVAIEQPMGFGRQGTNALLNRVVGAIVASLPTSLRTPERCWMVTAQEWKHGLGLKGKPTQLDFPRLAGASFTSVVPNIGIDFGRWQDAMDAYCLALFARDSLAAASRADSTSVGAPSSPDRKAL